MALMLTGLHQRCMTLMLTDLHWSMHDFDVDCNNRLCKMLQRHGDAPLTYDAVCETPLIRLSDFSEQLINLSMMA